MCGRRRVEPLGPVFDSGVSSADAAPSLYLLQLPGPPISMALQSRPLPEAGTSLLDPLLGA